MGKIEAGGQEEFISPWPLSSLLLVFLVWTVVGEKKT